MERRERGVGSCRCERLWIRPYSGRQRLAGSEAQARRVRAALERHLRAQSGDQGRDLRARRRPLPRQEYGRGKRRALDRAPHRDRDRRQGRGAGVAGRRAGHHLRRLFCPRAAAEASRHRRQRLCRLRAGRSVSRAWQRGGAVHPQGPFADEFRRDAGKILDARDARSRHRHPPARRADGGTRIAGQEDPGSGGRPGISRLRLPAVGGRTQRQCRAASS